MVLTVFGSDCQTGEFGGLFLRIGVEGGAGDDGVVAHEDVEVFDFLFQRGAAARYEYALFFHGTDEGDDVVDVVGGGWAQLVVVFGGYHDAFAVTGEEFLQECAFACVVDEMHAGDALFADISGEVEALAEPCVGVLAVTGGGGVELVRVLGGKVVFDLGAEVDEFVGFDGGGGGGSDFVAVEVVAFAGVAEADGVHEDDGVVGKVFADGFGVDFADAAGHGEVNAFEDAQRFGGEVVAAADLNGGVLHGGVDRAHGKGGFNGELYAAGGVDDGGHMGFFADAVVAAKAGSESCGGKVAFDLAANRRHEYEANAEAVQEGAVVQHGGHVRIVEVGFKMQDEGFAAVAVDVGRGLAEKGEKVLAIHGGW